MVPEPARVGNDDLRRPRGATVKRSQNLANQNFWTYWA